MSDNYKPTRTHWNKWTKINNFSPLVVDSAEYLIGGVLQRPFAPTGPGIGKLRKVEAFLHFMCLLKGEDGQVRSPDDIHKVPPLLCLRTLSAMLPRDPVCGVICDLSC